METQQSTQTATMSERECYRRICLFQKAEYIPNYDSVAKTRLAARWHQEGLPKHIQTQDEIREYFGLLKHPEIHRRISYGPIPGVPDRDKDLPTLPDYDVGRDAWGRIGAWHKNNDGSDVWAEGAYEIIRGALQSRSEWDTIKDHFLPSIRERYGDDREKDPWPELVEKWKNHTHALVLEVPSMIGAVKEIMGFENYCTKIYEDPEMMEDIMDKRTDLAIAILDRALDEVEFDMIWFWEDIGFRNGPIVSPEIFETMATPRYKRIADWYRSRGGEIVAVDSDGDVRLLIPGWIKGGINHIWPLEPFAGMDVVALRKEYGHAFSMRGGIDKFCVGKGKEAIDRELDRIFPVVQDGGYIPHLDHMLPDCSFDDYCYYIERKKKMLASV